MKASECKCCKCGKPAVAFWPVIDPDIPQHPYCRKCLDAEKQKAMIAIFGEENGKAWFDAWNADKKKKKPNRKSLNCKSTSCPTTTSGSTCSACREPSRET